MLQAIPLLVAAATAVHAPAHTRASVGDQRAYEHAYHQVAKKFGSRAPGRDIVRYGLASGVSSDQDVVASTQRLNYMLAPPKVVSATPPSGSSVTYRSSVPTSSNGLWSVPGVPVSFAQCVAYRESSNGTTTTDVYGLTSVPGSANMSIAQQKAIFSRMYQQYGTAPWAPYDGC
jgi:hypothetical protein